MTDLGTLGGIDSFALAQGINASGQVVGESTKADDNAHAFIIGPNGVGMVDLNSLVHPLGGFSQKSPASMTQGRLLPSESFRSARATRSFLEVRP
jgi:probable HAF family extracellular repeat protein